MTTLDGKKIRLYETNYLVTPNDRDYKIAADRYQAWNERTGPRVGDFVIMPTGVIERFSHDWDEDIQTCFQGSFYFGHGYASMSGGLNAAIPKSKITDTGETKPGHFWFFHNDCAHAHNGVGMEADCRVYKYEEA